MSLKESNSSNVFISVHYRIFGLTPRMNPVERDNETRTDASIDIDIVVCIVVYISKHRIGSKMIGLLHCYATSIAKSTITEHC